MDDIDEELLLRREQREMRRRAAFRRAVKITAFPIIMGIACWLIVPRAIKHIDEYQDWKFEQETKRLKEGKK